MRYAIPLAAVAMSIGVGFAGVASAETATTGLATSGAGIVQKMHGRMKERPGVMGTVTAVSGNTVTLTGKDGKTYTVDATSAEIGKMTTITIGQIAVGDTIGVQGTVSLSANGQAGTVTAKHIMDGVPPMHDGPEDK